MTNRQAISRVKSMNKEVNADSRMTNKFIYTIIQNNMNWLIHRESENLKLVNLNGVYQTIKCTDIIEVSKIDVCCGVASKCSVWRTKNKLPELYEDGAGVILGTITSIDDSKNIKLITATEVNRKLEDPHLKNTITKYAFYSDGYLYFPKKAWKKVNIEGYFKEEITNNCEDCDTDTNDCIRFLDQKLRFPEYLESQLFDAVEKEIAGIYKKLPEKAHTINKNDNE